jgi:hypothetical protein
MTVGLNGSHPGAYGRSANARLGGKREVACAHTPGEAAQSNEAAIPDLMLDCIGRGEHAAMRIAREAQARGIRVILLTSLRHGLDPGHSAGKPAGAGKTAFAASTPGICRSSAIGSRPSIGGRTLTGGP